MQNFTDQDGKSKTASAVDQEHYPEQNEVAVPAEQPRPLPTQEQIADRAFHRWREAGCPEGQDERHWLEAEGELQAAASHGGSVQR